MSMPKFKVGDKVDYVNDFGVVFKGRVVKGVEVKDGEFVYNIEPTDTPWRLARERHLHKAGTYKPENFNLLLRNGETAKFLCNDFYCRKVFLIPDDEKILEAVLVDGSMYTRNAYEEPCCKFDNDLQPDITSLQT